MSHTQFPHWTALLFPLLFGTPLSAQIVSWYPPIGVGVRESANLTWSGEFGIGGGHEALVWSEQVDGSISLFVRLCDANGQLIGDAPFSLDTRETMIGIPSIASLASGGAILLWTDHASYGRAHLVWIDPDGRRVREVDYTPPPGAFPNR